MNDKHVVRTWLMQEQIRSGGEPRNCLVQIIPKISLPLSTEQVLQKDGMKRTNNDKIEERCGCSKAL